MRRLLFVLAAAAMSLALATAARADDLLIFAAASTKNAVDDIIAYDYADPISLGTYVLRDYDSNGTWYIWEKREDWERTSLADFGEPAPQYVMYRNNMQIDNRLIEMRNGDLDVIHDLSPEAMFSIIEEDENVRGWFPGFPYAHPDPTLPMKGPGRNFEEASWMALATISLPVPVAPSMSTVVVVWETLLISSKIPCIRAFLLMILWKE